MLGRHAQDVSRRPATQRFHDRYSKEVRFTQGAFCRRGLITPCYAELQGLCAATLSPESPAPAGPDSVQPSQALHT